MLSSRSCDIEARDIRRRSDKLYELTGDFTLHRRTKSRTVPVKFIGERKNLCVAYRTGFETEFAIHRSAYSMTKYIRTAGDKVEVTLVIEGMRQ